MECGCRGGERGAAIIGLLGFDGGAARALCDESIVVPSFNYGQVEDVHLVIGHIVSQYLRQRLAVVSAAAETNRRSSSRPAR